MSSVRALSNAVSASCEHSSAEKPVRAHSHSTSVKKVDFGELIAGPVFGYTAVRIDLHIVSLTSQP